MSDELWKDWYEVLDRDIEPEYPDIPELPDDEEEE